VRLIRLPPERASLSGEHGMAPAPIAAAVGHVFVEWQVIPAVDESRIVQRGLVPEQPPHRRRLDQGKPAPADPVHQIDDFVSGRPRRTRRWNGCRGH
jgi:hypothetical protein